MSRASSLRRSKKFTLSSKNTLAHNDAKKKDGEAPLSPFARRLIKRVQNTAHKFSLWKRGEVFIVGVSGGPDSLCLLDMLFILSRKYGFALHIAHVNYHLRGRASDLDQQLVEKMAARYRFPCAVLSCTPQASQSSEETLRDIRYAFFETLRDKIGADTIVVAHNQDDQAETLLLRLLRGSGLAGLAAMRPKNNHIIRPLIETSRGDILRYLKECKLPFREDKSNRSPRYLRNRIRHELIPLLERHFQPQTRQLLAETAIILGDDYALLEKKLPKVSSLSHDTSEVIFSRRALLGLSPVALHHTLRATLKPLFAGRPPVKRLLYEIVKSIQSKKSKSRTVTFRGLKLLCKGDTVRLLKLT